MRSCFGNAPSGSRQCRFPAIVHRSQEIGHDSFAIRCEVEGDPAAAAATIFNPVEFMQAGEQSAGVCQAHSGDSAQAVQLVVAVDPLSCLEGEEDLCSGQFQTGEPIQYPLPPADQPYCREGRRLRACHAGLTVTPITGAARL